MKHIFLTMLVVAVLAACAPVQMPPPDDGVVTSPPDLPVNSDTPTPYPLDDLKPAPGDDKLLRDAVYLDSVDLLVMESYPPQFSLSLQGNLPTPCNQLRVAVNQPDAENKIVVDVYSLSAPDAICIEMLQPFSVNFPLGSFPAGHYTLWVNGKQEAEFDA